MGFANILAWDAVFHVGKKTVFGIEMTEVQNVGLSCKSSDIMIIIIMIKLL